MLDFHPSLGSPGQLLLPLGPFALGLEFALSLPVGPELLLPGGGGLTLFLLAGRHFALSGLGLGALLTQLLGASGLLLLLPSLQLLLALGLRRRLPLAIVRHLLLALG